MVFLGEKDIDSDEVQCIVANLIEKVSIKYYTCTCTGTSAISCASIEFEIVFEPS